MPNQFSVSDIYDKNLNFLIGSGASSGLLPTLELKINGANGSPHTIETLATALGEGDPKFIPLFMHYYIKCIRPAQRLTIQEIDSDPIKSAVFNNYKRFLETLLRLLLRRKQMDRRCNVFTTNYDGCIPFAADAILRQGAFDFILNDGAQGFLKRTVQVRAFQNYVMQTGIFERHLVNVPQVNLVHLHGSVYWKKDNDDIVVDYERVDSEGLLSDEVVNAIEGFSEALLNASLTVDDLPVPNISEDKKDTFRKQFRLLPIVNPTKWKFHETVFDEHYYQMLRMLSYELEKPNSTLVTFGFSFADEHILSLIKRSLSNPTLQVFICCFDLKEAGRIRELFKAYRNVKIVEAEDGELDFEYFNESVLRISSESVGAAQEFVANAGASTP